MKLSPKQRTYKKKTKNEVSRRKYTVSYFVKVNGTDVQICKKEFLAVHGLQKSKKRVDLLQQQISAGFATPKSDGRGKHSNHKNKVPEEAYRLAKEHIESIPRYTSHYSRKKNPGKSYIDHDLNITSLYFEYYIPWCEERGIQPVSKDKYRRIFCTDFNIGFKLPKSDTCKTCDSLKIKIDDTTDSNLQKKLKVELELHQRRAEAMRDSLKNEIVRAKTDGNIAIISVDLQQALPVPNVTTGPAFYLRKLWVYNLGIHDCVTDQAYMYMWSEDLAKRGSDEICSIIYKYIKDNNISAEHLIVYSDNCSGQNKNWAIMSLWRQLVAEKVFKSVEHRFLVVGHTHLPSDRDFAIIEKYKKKMKSVYEPKDWYNAVRVCNRAKPFHVTVLQRKDFMTFKVLENSIVKKKFSDEKLPVSFSKIAVFRFENENFNVMKIKHLLNESFKNVNIGKRGLRRSLLCETLTQKYTDKVSINEKKTQKFSSATTIHSPSESQVLRGNRSEISSSR